MHTLPAPPFKGMGKLIHIAAWAILFGLPFFFTGRESQTVTVLSYVRSMIVPLSFMLVFYANYFVLIDHFLFAKRPWKFLLCNVVLIAASMGAVHLMFELLPHPEWEHPRPEREWTWNCFVDKMLNRAEKRIKRKNYFDFNKIYIIKKLQQEIQEYLDKVPIAPYLDDISTKNLLIYEGNVSGIIDIDWMGFGDMLTFVALTRVSLLNMDLDTKYIDYLLDEIRPNTIEYKAFIFYCLIYCVDFMGERGMQFLDKTIPVNENIIERLNDIFDFLMEEWDKYCKR